MSGSQSTYVERAITITIRLGEGTFGDTGSNTVTLEGLRVLATIEKTAPPGFGRAEIRVYGMTQSVMNQVSTLGVPFRMYRQGNIVTVQAGQKGTPLPVVWIGYILNAWQVLEGAPDTYFQIVSNAGVLEAMVPGAPLSFPGPIDVASVMAGLATRMGRVFVNDGVTAKLSGGYFPGTAMAQAIAIARAAGVEMEPGGGPGDTLTIWPKDRTRIGVVPLISANTGMIGYPQYRDNAMAFRCLFNPNIVRGGQILMDSSLFPSATSSDQSPEAVLRRGGPNGYWYVNSPFILNLSAQVPNGPWFNECTCSRALRP
jgi:hypothetical protein